jgi:tRNA modification GTPase
VSDRTPLPLVGADDTIVAIATPPGRGALAIVRVSGPRAFELAARLIAPWPLPPRTARLCALRDAETGELLDRPVVTTFEAPRSYTGEHVVEIATHGGYLTPATVVRAFIALGAREALPGEFTRRAVANGKLDIVQAEAVSDLVDARSRAGQRSALAQLDGNLSRRILALRDAILTVEALIAYDIDFPEEDDGPVSLERILAAADQVLARIDALLATAPAGALIREGAVIVLAGAPNVGKSSVFNALLGEARAIVTDIPGTTRDAVEATIDNGDWPLRLVDTAGLRDTEDVVERLGVEVSERYVRRAHLVLVCGETDASLALSARRIALLTSAPMLAVRTKADLVTKRDEIASVATDIPFAGPVAVSAVTGVGLAALLAHTARLLAEHHGTPDAELPMLTRARHREGLERAREEMAAFAAAWRAGELPAPVAAVHLRSASAALESLIGAIDVDDVLDRLFATFCIGK